MAVIGKTKILLAFVGALVVIVAVLLVSPMLFNRGSRASASSVREIPTSSTGANVDMVVDKPGDEDYQGIGPVSELPTGTVIDGYPVARGQFNAKGELKAFYSSAPIEFHGDTLPTGTWIKLDADQRIATVVFPEDTTIQGYRIRGGYMDEVTVDSLGYEKWSGLSKILPWSATYFRLTRFHPNGTLELFSSREDVMVQNIPCMGSPLTGVLLWENGELRGCTMARDATVGDVSLKAGNNMWWNARGQLQTADKPWPLTTAERLIGWLF